MEFDKRDLEELRDNERQGYPPIKSSTLYKMYKNGDRSKKLFSIMSFNLRIREFSEWDLVPSDNYFKDEYIKEYVAPALRDYFYFLSSVKDDNLKNQGLKDLYECFYFLIRDKDKNFVLKEYVEGSKSVVNENFTQRENDKIANEFIKFISSLVEDIDSNEEFWIARNIAISWSNNEQREKNFKETGIKETDYERDKRESKEKEIEKNLKETGIRETDYEREQREYEEKIQKEEELEEEMIQKYAPIAESLVEDYKSGLIDKNKLEAQLNDMKSKGMLYEEYIYNLLDSIEED